jgi:hypothetical protein
VSGGAETIQLLDSLIQAGFDEQSFQRLHHWWINSIEPKSETTLQAHREYCSPDRNFIVGSNNEIVLKRLRWVFDAYQIFGSKRKDRRIFNALSDAAFFGIS